MQDRKGAAAKHDAAEGSLDRGRGGKSGRLRMASWCLVGNEGMDLYGSPYVLPLIIPRTHSLIPY